MRCDANQTDTRNHSADAKHLLSFAFVRWLFNHPKLSAERAATMESKEAVLWEPDAATRSELAMKDRHLTTSIDDALSISIVTKRKDRRENAAWPWMLK